MTAAISIAKIRQMIETIWAENGVLKPKIEIEHEDRAITIIAPIGKAKRNEDEKWILLQPFTTEERFRFSDHRFVEPNRGILESEPILVEMIAMQDSEADGQGGLQTLDPLTQKLFHDLERALVEHGFPRNKLVKEIGDHF